MSAPETADETSSSAVPQQQQQTVPITSLPLPTLSRLQQQLSSDLEHLSTSYQRLRAAQVRFRDCISSIRKVQSMTTVSTTRQLVPLTTSLYVPATPASASSRGGAEGTVLVDVGTGFYVEKTYAQGVKFYEGKVADLEANLKTVEESVRGKTETLRSVEDAMRRAVVAQQQQQQKHPQAQTQDGKGKDKGAGGG